MTRPTKPPTSAPSLQSTLWPLVRRVDSGLYAANSEVMLEYEKAKRRVEPSAYIRTRSLRLLLRLLTLPPRTVTPTTLLWPLRRQPAVLSASSSQLSVPVVHLIWTARSALLPRHHHASHLCLHSEGGCLSPHLAAASSPACISLVGHLLPLVLLGTVLYMAVPAASSGGGLMSRGQYQGVQARRRRAQGPLLAT